MHLACFSFGFGALLVNLSSKKGLEDREKFQKYFEFNFNESNDPAVKNAVFSVTDRFSAKLKQSHTQRMLDSNASFTSI